ncbi:hypothetical protein NL676_000165 [Syzygium grande]|nr:hypothetical protein NL676_000165 [Syzygium grande]
MIGGLQMLAAQVTIGAIMAAKLGDHGEISEAYAYLSITVAVGFLLIYLGAQTFLSMLCHFRSGLFFFFGGWAAIMTVFVHLLLPETKNVPIEQMDKIWREHWFWKEIVGEIDVKTNKIEA